MNPTRDDAWQLLCQFNESDALRKHALAVEGVMRHFARRRGADEELWGIDELLESGARTIGDVRSLLVRSGT
jgi:predicted hydrolase (HD superfamily)